MKQNISEGKRDKKTSRPPNCFMIFSQENRPAIQVEFPKMSNSEISKLLGERWRFLHPNKKNVYRQKAEKLKHDLENQTPPTSPSTPLAPSPLPCMKKREREEVDEEEKNLFSKRSKTTESDINYPIDLQLSASFSSDLFGDHHFPESYSRFKFSR